MLYVLHKIIFGQTNNFFCKGSLHYKYIFGIILLGLFRHAYMELNDNIFINNRVEGVI